MVQLRRLLFPELRRALAHRHDRTSPAEDLDTLLRRESRQLGENYRVTAPRDDNLSEFQQVLGGPMERA